ncbi:hypothetical protein SNEBB_008675 [Seison nebaliae]|nr:hypothetical protein SNEBB_008675 [Seison nebaliae]
MSKKMKDLSDNDRSLLSKGVSFTVNYIGYIYVERPMREIDFNTRTLIAEEAINRVCGLHAGRSTAKSPTDDESRFVMEQCLSDTPMTESSTKSASLVISTDKFKIVSPSSKSICEHNMQDISFASGPSNGGSEEYVAYVAKDTRRGRACHVFKAQSPNLAYEILQMMGTAFDLRYEVFMKEKKTNNGNNELVKDSKSKKSVNATSNVAPSVPSSKKFSGNFNHHHSQHQNNNNRSNSHQNDSSKSDKNNNNTHHSTSNNHGGSSSHSNNFKANRNHFPANDEPKPSAGENKHQMRNSLKKEIWYHGAINRHDAESLLQNHGDFLVRDSSNIDDQYVLSGRFQSDIRHLLLVDPEGKIRTKDKEFVSIRHLIQYHLKYRIPIVSNGSQLILVSPVPSNNH